MNPAPPTTILVVEDDELIRQVLAEILELNGYTVLQAVDGNQGFELAAKMRPAIILTDVSMPGLNGFELIERLRADPVLRSTRVIIVSALAERADVRRGMECGADDYISKPFKESEVVNAIRAQLAKSRPLA